MPSKVNVSSTPTNDATGSPYLRIGGLAGIGFAGLILLINLLVLVPAGMPTTGAGLGEVSEFFATGGGSVGLASGFLPITWALATVFGAGVVAATRGSERARDEAWSLVGLAGVLLQNATITVISAVRLALASTGGEDPGGGDRGATAGLWAFHDAAFTLNGTFLALALVGLSLAGLRGRLIRPWQAALGFVAAALQFASASLTPLVMEHGGVLGQIGLAGWLLWVVWLGCYGVTLIRLSRPGRSPRSCRRS